MSALAILVTTAGDEAQARAIAQAALSAKLAACVHIYEIRAHYVWQGELREDEEFRLELKTTPERYEALAKLVRGLHSYETPEILRLDASAVDPAYLAWARDAVAV